MNLVLGATGQVGSAIVEQLVNHQQSVKAVVRNIEKAKSLQEQNIPIAVADAFDLEPLKGAFKGARCAFLLTPETGKSHDVIGDTQKILENYRAALAGSGIEKIVGLSSMGAQYAEHSGNLKMSYLLEHAFLDLKIQQLFVRPSFYYSNWLSFLSVAKEQGILPSFYPLDLKIPMCSPLDIAAYVAELMHKPITDPKVIYEVEGPEWYSAHDIANIYAEVLGREVVVQEIPSDQWPETIRQMGFTEDAIHNFIEMTNTVVQGKAKPQGLGCVSIKVPTGFKQYLEERLQ